MKKLSFVLSFLFASFTLLAQSPTKFSKAEVLEDLAYLYSSLQETHYDLFAYTSKATFDEAYSKIEASVTQDSLTYLEATNVLQRLASMARNGHTGVEFPVQSYIDYAYGGGTIFPLEIAFEEGKPLVRKNWSANEKILPGDQLLSIKGMPMEKVLERIYPQISAERRYFAQAKVELFTLARYYWLIFGEVEQFEVELATEQGLQKYTLPAIKALDDYEMKRTDILNAHMQLDFYNNVAYLNPGHFSGEEVTYQAFIDSAFAEIRQRDAEQLIIDLRNNGGGEDSFSDYLVSYLADRPFQWSARFSLKTSDLLKAHIRQERDTTSTFWQSALLHESGQVYQYDFPDYQPQAEQRRFRGQVYVLVNRQSHSQSAVTAAQIQDYDFGTIVGEETGEYPSLYASIFNYALPNTGIPVRVSKGHIVRVNGSTKEEGVMPDIVIKDYLLDEKDEILEGLLQRLGQEKPLH